MASILSNSLSVISSLMDSAVDLASGLTLWFTARQMRKSLPYTYPTGEEKTENCRSSGSITLKERLSTFHLSRAQ